MHRRVFLRQRREVDCVRGWALFTALDAARLRPVDDFANLRREHLIGWSGGLLSQMVEQALAALAPDVRLLCRTTSLIANAAFAAAGGASAPLPCLLGETTNGLQAIAKPLDGLAAEVWALTHEDLRRNARVRALMERLADAAENDAGLLSGAA